MKTNAIYDFIVERKQGKAYVVDDFLCKLVVYCKKEDENPKMQDFILGLLASFVECDNCSIKDALVHMLEELECDSDDSLKDYVYYVDWLYDDYENQHQYTRHKQLKSV